MTVAAHALKRTLTEVAWFPAHPPRKASAEYTRVHRHLVVELDSPCWICGVRHSDLKRMTATDARLYTLETHHCELEWAQEPAVEADAKMLARFYADLHGKLTTATPDAVRRFLDSEGNLLVLCATHHRGSGTGIHSITYPAWKAQRLQFADVDAFEFIRQPHPSIA